MKPSLLPPSRPSTGTYSQSLANIAATSLMEQLAQTALSEPHPRRPTDARKGLSTPQPQINRAMLRAVLKEALDLLDDYEADFPEL